MSETLRIVRVLGFVAERFVEGSGRRVLFQNIERPQFATSAASPFLACGYQGPAHPAAAAGDHHFRDMRHRPAGEEVIDEHDPGEAGLRGSTATPCSGPTRTWPRTAPLSALTMSNAWLPEWAA